MSDTISDPKATDRVKDGIDTARDKAAHAYEAARDRATDAVEASREKAQQAARQAAETMESNPVGVLVGGLALGALVAAIIPRGEREKKLLAPVGKGVGLAATAAIAAAKEAGRGELEARGLTASAAKSQVRGLLGDMVKAATTAGNAAVKAGSEQVRKR